MRTLRDWLKTRVSLVWLLLMAVTVASWAVGHGMGFADERHAGVAVIVAAFVKVRYVLLDFMELRHAPAAMRLGVQVWAGAICVVLMALYAWPAAQG